MPKTQLHALDKKYLAVLLKRIEVCKSYKPKFGQGGKDGLSLDEFRALYGADDFYSWFGLDNPLMYAAHKAAGGITSVYRQIGTGCEQVFRLILQDQFGLSAQQAKWEYEIKISTGKARKLSLDGRVELSHIASDLVQDKVSRWLKEAATYLEVAPEIVQALKGAVFEVRQGYKSKDSKRQNADIANAAHAYSQGYLPVVVVLSTQIDSDIAARYEHEKWLILRGHLKGTSIESTYTFLRTVIGYDLAKFFQGTKNKLKQAVEDVLSTLLKTDEQTKK